ncbi:MAG: D-amino-acid dehydrogenase, partial [Rhodococcus sp. (in: high G+C Gram-positive bacteria)]
MPIIGRLPHHPNVTVATGHAMLGITLGPVTGELVARSVFGR